MGLCSCEGQLNESAIYVNRAICRRCSQYYCRECGEECSGDENCTSCLSVCEKQPYKRQSITFAYGDFPEEDEEDFNIIDPEGRGFETHSPQKLKAEAIPWVGEDGSCIPFPNTKNEK